MGNNSSIPLKCDFNSREELSTYQSFNDKFKCILNDFDTNTLSFENNDIKIYLIISMFISGAIQFENFYNLSPIKKYPNGKEHFIFNIDLDNKLETQKVKQIISIASVKSYYLFYMSYGGHQTSLLVDAYNKKILYYDSNYGMEGANFITEFKQDYLNKIFNENFFKEDYEIKFLNGNQTESNHCVGYSFNFILTVVDDLTRNEGEINYAAIYNRLDRTTSETLCENFYKNLYKNFTSKDFNFNNNGKKLILDFINAYNLIYLLNGNKTTLNLTDNIITDDELLNKREFISNVLFLMETKYKILSSDIRIMTIQLLFKYKKEFLTSILCKYTYDDVKLKKFIKPEIKTNIDFYRDKNTVITYKKGLVSYDKNKFPNLALIRKSNDIEQDVSCEPFVKEWDDKFIRRNYIIGNYDKILGLDKVRFI